MIYLDNAATMYPRPDCVKDAIIWALDHTGNPGRSSHPAAFAGDQVLTGTREALAQFFHVDTPERIVFAHNTTDALNTAFYSFLTPRSHVVTTVLEHNSVLRPLYHLQKLRQIDLTILSPDSDGIIQPDHVQSAIGDRTSLVAVTHVSNVTGAIEPVADIVKVCRRKGVACLIDGAQAAGHMPVDLSQIDPDFYAFAGHKGLCGPQGTGGLYVSPRVCPAPFKCGGTGVMTFSHEMPDDFPEHLEAGTQNVHGLNGLQAGVRFLMQQDTNAIHAHETQLANKLIDALCDMDCILYVPRDPAHRSGVVSFNLGNLESTQVGDALAQRGICVRAGFHCAPLLHEAMQTKTRGAVRVSFSLFNTQQDVDALLDALREIQQN
jgi:cysteine desulfurase family protein